MSSCCFLPLTVYLVVIELYEEVPKLLLVKPTTSRYLTDWVAFVVRVVVQELAYPINVL